MQVDDAPITIKLNDKPNLKMLRFNKPDKFREVLAAALALAEEAAYDQEDRKIAWFDLPSKFHKDLNFKNTLLAVSKAFFDAEALNKESFSILEEDVHAMSIFKSESDRTGTYTDWRSHFDFSSDEPFTPDVITKTIRKLLYYSRFINVEQYGKSLLTNHLAVHQSLPSLNAERLPFVPALRYQQAHFGDLQVGKFWDNIGAFYGANVDMIPTECPACRKKSMEKISEYYVCNHCNLGVKVL